MPVPEISMVGKTEQQLTDAGIPYEAGIAQYREIARGKLLGDDIGMLKLLIHPGKTVASWACTSSAPGRPS